MGFQLKNEKNFYWGIDIAARGSDVKEDNIIDIIVADSTDIIDVNGNTATVRFWERGAQTQFVFGKIFPVIGPNENSGFFSWSLGFIYQKLGLRIWK